MIPINFLAIILSVVWAMFVGSMWYGPFFGKPWMKMMGLTKEGIKKLPQGYMAKLYGIQFVASFVMAYVLAHSIFFAQQFLQVSDFNAGISGGFWNWLGFVAPVTLGKVLWEGKPWKLWLIDSGNYLATLLGMGLILAFLH